MTTTRGDRLSRPMAALEIIATGSSATVAEVAHALAIPISSAFRTITSLVEEGLLTHSPEGRLSMGPRLVSIGLNVARTLPRISRLEQMVRRAAVDVPESVSAGLLVDDEIVLVARREPPELLRVVARVGDIINPVTSALGKAILSRLPEDRAQRIVKYSANRGFPQISQRDIEAEIDEARVAGFARDEGVYALGQRCRAIPLTDSDGDVYGGLSVAGPSVRFSIAAADAAVAALRSAVNDEEQKSNREHE